jgi:hypothetical protein
MGKTVRARSCRNQQRYISYQDVTNAAYTDLYFIVYGMGIDLGTVLALMGTVWTGDPVSLDPSFSIGGRDTGVNNLLNNVGGVLG